MDFPFQWDNPIAIEKDVIYHGQWNNGKRNGRGKQVDKKGSIFEGSWKDDEPNGHGRKITSKGEIYDGDWVENRM